MQGNQQPFDSRTILAFALMAVVWIGWFALFPSETPPPADESDPAATEPMAQTPVEPQRDSPSTFEGTTSPAVPDTERAVVPTPDAREWTSTADTDRGSLIQVSTPLYEAQIDRVGGDIVSWRLREFDLVDGSPVDLVGERTLDPQSQRAHALRILLEDRALDLRQVRFETDRSSIALAADDEPSDLVLTAARGNGGGVEIVYRFHPDRYGFDVSARVFPGRGETLPTRWEVGWPGGIATTEPDSAREIRESKAVARVGDDIHKVSYGKLKGDGNDGRRIYEGSVSWSGVESLYFLSTVISVDPRLGEVRLDGDHDRGVQTFRAALGLEGRQPATVNYTVYMGPVDNDVLARYDGDPWNANMTALVDLGPGPFRWIAEVVLAGLRLLYGVIPNWGLTIILFSVFTKLLFWPLTKSSVMSMRRMQEMQPKMKKLQEKYKDDPQRQSKEMMALYKEHGVNPLNMGGCLPLLVQMPVFWALFTILRKSIDLRQAEFALWINDLSQPDVLFRLPFSLPIFGDHFSLLPFLMAVAMYLQTKFQQAPTGGSDNPMAKQMQLMMKFMPVMMFVVFYRSPSGLVLYWLVNTVLTAFQTWRISKTMPPVEPAKSSS